VLDVNNIEKVHCIGEITLNNAVGIAIGDAIFREFLAFLGGDIEMVVSEIHVDHLSTNLLDIVGLIENHDTIFQIDLHLRYMNYT